MAPLQRLAALLGPRGHQAGAVIAAHHGATPHLLMLVFAWSSPKQAARLCGSPDNSRANAFAANTTTRQPVRRCGACGTRHVVLSRPVTAGFDCAPHAADAARAAP